MTETLTPQEIDIMGIMKYLPHRYPFLLVDKILVIEPGREITGVKNVTINEPFFQGHFPSRPVFPGVLILEGMAQVGGVLAFHTYPDSVGEKLIYFAGIDNCRFKQPVLPGDQMILEVQVVKEKRGIWKFKGEALVDGKVVASADLMCAEQEIK